MRLDIRIDDPRAPGPMSLLREHLTDVTRHSPPESVHALDVEDLCAPEITFWTAWLDGAVAGCGALKELDPRHGEIKSMRTASAHLRKGVASAIVEHILDEAGRRGYVRMSLETGSQAAYEPARALYKRFGFADCGAFAQYRPDPNSVFMTLALGPDG